MNPIHQASRHETLHSCLAPRQGKRGFTVLEVLISMVIIVIGFAAIFSLLLQGTASERSAVHSTRASMLAASVFDDISAKYWTTWRDFDRDGTPAVFDENEEAPATFLDEAPSMKGYEYNVAYDYSRSFEAQEHNYAVFVRIQVIWNVEGEPFSKTWYRVIYPVPPEVV